MGANQGIAAMDPRTEQAFTRDQYDRVVRGEAIPGAAAVAGNTEVVEWHAAVAGDPGACVKLIKIAHRDAPRGVEKADAPAADAKPEPTRQLSETEHITGPVSVTDLIRKAQSNPGAIEDLERGYSGREQAALAKAAAAQPRRVSNADFDKVSPELRRAVATFDAIVKRAVERSLRPLAKIA